ncbi:MAG: DUF4276 family protein [Planctomycetes bacterium]|nr:DUF4276 family protein [Planctomycetota bacterium]
MTPVRLAAIVEGHGDAKAVPKLIHRIAGREFPEMMVIVDPVVRVPASQLLKEGELERQIERVARQMPSKGGILVLVDCDWADGCPKHDGPMLLQRARQTRPDVQISLVLAYREYETWFIAAAESLRGCRGLVLDLIGDPQPERIRGAKEWLSDRMPRGRPYSATIDQPAMTGVFDIQAARRTDSFDKCYREVVRLLNGLGASGGEGDHAPGEGG